MTKYVIKENDRLYVKPLSKGTPRNCVGQLPDGISTNDYKYLKADLQDNGQYSIYVDQIAKATDLPNVQAELAAEALIQLRLKRNSLLAECDWTQMTDSPLSESEVIAWANYRQALRDFPDNVSDVHNPDWPVKP